MNNKPDEKIAAWQNLMLTVAMLILLVCALLPLLDVFIPWLKWVYAFGAVLALAERMTERYHGKNVRIARLYRLGKVSAMLYCVSAFLLIYPLSGAATGRDWLAFLMAGALMQIYVSFAYDHAVRKQAKQEQDQQQ